eukprot:TRINITY_DN4120_c0_g1_i1.p1 TRINITY_DN4120_c0_g1~~TRINITY_DN4120_c0_g1_i1.p1  ORF type:complete len:748 (+),score=96.08 TRINITY_DN4120_c0_g1_i1:94-2244(+)
MKWCGCTRWLVHKAARSGESEAERQRKRITLSMVPFITVMTGSIAASQALMVGELDLYFFALSACTLLGFVIMANIVVTRRCTLRQLELGCVLYVIIVLAVDFDNAAVPGSLRVWSWVILAMDVLLTVGSRAIVQNLCIILTAISLTVFAVEDAYRLGLYDIDGVTEPNPDMLRERTSCTNPPCAKGAVAGFSTLIATFAVLVLDFLATRGFAEGQRREKQRILHMIFIAEQVASCLARFDLPSAENALAEAGRTGVPEDLSASLHRLLDNLASYRPYLPQSCFEADNDEEQSVQHDRQISKDDMDAPPVTPPAASREPREDPLEASGTSSAPSSRKSASTLDLVDLPQQARDVARRIAHVPQRKRVSLLACNHRGFIAASQQVRPAGLSAWFAVEVERFNTAVRDRKGVVGILSGDHLRASFGVLKALGEHRSSATACGVEQSARSDARQSRSGRAGSLAGSQVASSPPRVEDSASSRELICPTGSLSRRSVAKRRSSGPTRDCASLDALRVTAAVCTGDALCGDFGSNMVQRFMIIGTVNAMVHVVERAAAGWDAAVLIDDDVHADVGCNWNCRLRKRVTLVKHGSASRHRTMLWEVMSPRRGASRDAPPEEWMYQLAGLAPNPWEEYNLVVRMWCRGNTTEARERVDKALSAADMVTDTVRAAIAAVGRQIVEDKQPPICTVTAVSVVGWPAPTAEQPDQLHEADSPVHDFTS